MHPILIQGSRCDRCHRQAGNILCDASAKPGNRRPCNATSCAVAARQLRISFTPWGPCEAACGDGYNGRSAICENEDGIAADPNACPGYSGAHTYCHCAMQPASTQTDLIRYIKCCGAICSKQMCAAQKALVSKYFLAHFSKGLGFGDYSEVRGGQQIFDG